jgi:glycosyltransferase involved in cell wall biosynthesis
VSIGLPVFNGAVFLAVAIDSLLNQTYQNIELIISDNASTDATPEICKKYAAADRRVRYSRLTENIGGIPNHNRVFMLASGEYFMWASHDDIWQPTYIEKCIVCLEKDPRAVMACSKVGIVDEAGQIQRLLELPHVGDSPHTVQRFQCFTALYSFLEPTYGVIRTDILKRTVLHALHPGSDRILLAELALYGRCLRTPEYLHLRRDHGQRSIRAIPSIRDRYAWVKPENARKRSFPYWSYLTWYTRAVFRVPLTSKERLFCGLVLLKWIRYYWKELASDLALKP